MPKIADVKSKSRSKRKPLRDVSNGGFKPSNCNLNNSVMKKSISDAQQEDPPTICGGGHPLDRLLLVHSDLSVLIHQIDELVVRALEQKVRNTKAIESFAHVLQDMHSSLKPWISRFQKVISTHAKESDSQFQTSLASKKIPPSINEDTIKALDKPDIYKFDSMVSPSPLVSWRADCGAEGGRLKESSKFAFEKINNDVMGEPFAKNLNDSIGVKPIAGKLSDPVATNTKSTAENGFSSPEKLIRRNDFTVGSTPYLKMSPPKSCILLEPASECYKKNPISTKNPVMRHAVNGDGSGDTEPLSSKPSGHLALKYPEIFGIKAAHKLGNTRKVVEASPKWCISPPKSCVLLEPSDDKASSNDVVKDVERKLSMGGRIRTVVPHNAVIDSTPMCKDLDTTILRGKRAGENTLKKELWMRFEAATSDEFQFKACVGQQTANKGFMDLLEEVSSDDS